MKLDCYNFFYFCQHTFLWVCGLLKYKFNIFVSCCSWQKYPVRRLFRLIRWLGKFVCQSDLQVFCLFQLLFLDFGWSVSHSGLHLLFSFHCWWVSCQVLLVLRFEWWVVGCYHLYFWMFANVTYTVVLSKFGIYVRFYFLLTLPSLLIFRLIYRCGCCCSFEFFFAMQLVFQITIFNNTALTFSQLLSILFTCCIASWIGEFSGFGYGFGFASWSLSHSS